MDRNGYNVFIGSTTGVLKGASIGKDNIGIRTIIKSCIKGKENISNKKEVTCLNWGNESESEVLIGMKNRIRTYNTVTTEFSEDLEVPNAEICGLFKDKQMLFAGLTQGILRSWKHPYEEKNFDDLIKCDNIERMKRSPSKPNVIATGGNENDLKLWDLETRKNTFLAKNIKPDELQLRVPVWVSDVTFFHNNEKISTCTRHGFVRLYDPSLPQRRPAINIHNPNEVFTCMSETPNENQILVGSGSGNLYLVDFRNKSAFAGKYKGFCGAVKSISCPINQNLILTTSLDRHFRIHDFTSRKLLVKEYLVSRLTSILPKEPFELQQFKKEEIEENDSGEDSETEELKNESKNKKRKSKDSKTLDKIFSTLPEVNEEEVDDEEEEFDDEEKEAEDKEKNASLKRKKLVEMAKKETSAKKIRWKKQC